MNTSTKAPLPEIILSVPYGSLHIEDANDASDHAIMRARQLARLLMMMQPETGPDDALWLAQQMADEIVGALCGMLGVPV